MTGKVAQLFPCQGGGYGFIESDDGERLYFSAHGLQMSSVQFCYLQVGDRCRFTAIDHPKGPRGIEVFVADSRQGSLL